MPNTLSTFLTKVATDPKTSIAFNKNAQSVIAGSTLSASAKAAVLSKNPGLIKSEILKEKGVGANGLNAAGDTEVVLVIVV